MNSSLWALTTPEIPGDGGIPPTQTDIVIAGAGLAGLSLAWMLSATGADVVVIEARDIGSVATGNTTGKASLLQGSVLSDLLAHADEETVAAYVESTRAAQAWLRERFDTEPQVLVPKDAITYARTPDGVAALDREQAVLESTGIRVERLERSRQGDLGLPFDVESALRLPGQLQLHPMRLLHRLSGELRAQGVRILTGCRVTDARLVDGGVDVTTRRGTVRCSRLVLATGTPILDRGLFFAKLTVSRSFVGAFALREPDTAPRGMFLSADGDGRSLRTDVMPDGTRGVVVGGGVHPTGRAPRTAPLRDEIDEWTLSQWPRAQRVTGWAAQDYRMVTRVPFAGPLPRGGDRIFAATGFNKWGMTNGVAAALRLTGLLTGQSPPWDEPLRRSHLGLAPAAEAARAGAETGGHLIADWARLAATPVPAVPPAEGEGRVVRDGATPIAESTISGSTRRVSAACTHLGGILTWNDAECTWDCPLHGSRFSPGGRVLEGPAVRDLRLEPETDRPSS